MGSQQLIVAFATLGGMTIAAASVVGGGASLGDLVAVNSYVLGVFVPFSFLGSIYNMSVEAIVDMRSFGQVLAEKPSVVDPPGKAPELDVEASIGQPMIKFDRVSFAYADQPDARSVKDVSFEVPRGGTLALVGPTGSGKTTITRLLLRLFDPTGGQVLINGQDVRGVRQQSLRGALGVVPQDVVMFNASISHNINYGRLGAATDEEIQKAAARAQLSKFIEQHPDGYEALVGERGMKLSGGERQRLAIARCILKDPPIVVLDEATSALDTQTERQVQQALDMLSTDRTVVAIAHRLSTVREFDQILVLVDGEVAERGTHQSLLAQEGSRYAAMWKEQELGLADGNRGEA